MRMKCVPALLLPLVLTALWSCQSLPLPDTPEKSLLVIPCDFSLGSNASGRRVVDISLVLSPTVGTPGVKERKLSLPLGKRYAVFAVDPGSYTISSVIISNGWFDNGRQWNAWEDKHVLGAAVFVAPQVILLNYTLFKYADRADPNKGYDFSFYQFGLDRGPDILAQMKKDPHWAAWEGYPLVNFPEE